MADLFFDSPTYPWHLNEAKEFHVLLYSVITDAGQIDRIRKTCGSNVLPLAQKVPADDMWKQLLDHVAAAGRLRELDRELRGMSPHIVTALDKLIAAVSPDPTTWVFDNPIFVNRANLRTAVAQLASAMTFKNVLVVRGEQWSGKSWTKHVIRHYARISGEGCTYLCEGLVTTVAQAVGYIFAELGAQTPQTLSTEAASYTTVAQAMLTAAQARQRGSWIIMDDLGIGPDGAPLVEQEIRRLFDQLALNTVNPAFAQWFKLVLIAYPEAPLPSKWRQCSLEVRTAVSDVDEAAVSEFLSNWAQRHSKALSDANAAALANGIIQDASFPPSAEDSRSKLERVHDQLTIILGKL